MIAIIPAKCSSERVPDKNWREFHKGKSLVDINIAALYAAGVEPHQIYVSCENDARLEQVSRRWGICCLKRPDELCANSVPITTWIRSICGQVDGDDDVIWSQVCDPLFREHRQVIEAWHAVRGKHDSICVVHPGPHYLLDDRHRPIGWGFGEWHTPSQKLRPCYTFPFTMSILTREAIAKTGYHIGADPYWYTAEGRSIDIDTEEDFRAAQILYAESSAKGWRQ